MTPRSFRKPQGHHHLISTVLSGLFLMNALLRAEDAPQWGQLSTRNMISNEVGLPESFDIGTGQNVKWSIPLGTRTYSTPVVAGGKILIGTNNGLPRDPRHEGDRGVLMCFSEQTGKFLWQLVVPKLDKELSYKDWPQVGIVSPATVDGDHVYLLNNRGIIMCLDLNGQQNGNEGPFKNEGRAMAPLDEDPMKITSRDADIIWQYDLETELGVHQHDSAHCSILVHGSFLYICTSNGVDTTHRIMLAPEAPSLVVLNKNTGRLVARDKEPIGPQIVHCTWSSPSVAKVDGRSLIFFGAGNGTCYAFEAVPESSGAATSPQALKKVWWFNGDLNAPKDGVHQYQGNRRISPSNIYGMPVVHQNRLFVTFGGDYWHGKRKAWLRCIDLSGNGDITESGEQWSYPLVRHCMSTPAVHNGLVFIADCGRTLHCVDANTGKAYWTHDTNGITWGSPLVADGKVYLGTQRGDFWILEAGKEKKILSKVDLFEPINSTPTAANGVLFVATSKHLYALETSDTNP
jgi:outer membrane protein assembly factor BamB